MPPQSPPKQPRIGRDLELSRLPAALRYDRKDTEVPGSPLRAGIQIPEPEPEEPTPRAQTGRVADISAPARRTDW